ncbi:MAG: hypothetical protein JWR19_4215 [Pedosphaera sp.]|nr:hypothetical protein [Pedosphaera sp.]
MKSHGQLEKVVTRLRLLYLSYNALSDGGEQQEKHYTEFHAWLKDRYPEYGKANTFFR